jgi:hypothetical protein
MCGFLLQNIGIRSNGVMRAAILDEIEKMGKELEDKNGWATRTRYVKDSLYKSFHENNTGIC